MHEGAINSHHLCNLSEAGDLDRCCLCRLLISLNPGDPDALSEFTELAKSRFLDCDSCGMTQGALIRNVADCQALYMQAKQPRSDILYMTTLDTGRCSHSTCSLVVLIALYLTIPMAASRSTDSS